jgi:hypothetical protein
MDVEFLSSVREHFKAANSSQISDGAVSIARTLAAGHAFILGSPAKSHLVLFPSSGEIHRTRKDHHDSASALPAMLREPSRKLGKQGEA